MTRAALSVVVPCRDRAELLRGCLTALAGSTAAQDEVLVVDAASSSDQVRAVADQASVRCVTSPQGSASAARNAGWRAATHPLVAFVDDDCRPVAGWADATVAALAELDAVCGQVRGQGDGHLSVLTRPTAQDYAPSTPFADLGHGANLGARRDVLAAAGGWDETLGPGTTAGAAEDKELLLRLVRRGARVGYRPEPVVEHLQWRTRRQALEAELRYAKGAGRLRARGLPTGSAARELRLAAADLRHGYQYGAVAGVVRAVGFAWGRRT